MALLLYTQICSTLTMLLSIMTFDEFNSVWFAVKLFPARSMAVMLNDTSPSALSSTEYVSHVCIRDCTCLHSSDMHRAQDLGNVMQLCKCLIPASDCDGQTRQNILSIMVARDPVMASVASTIGTITLQRWIDSNNITTLLF